jgi:hypothetical protein
VDCFDHRGGEEMDDFLADDFGHHMRGRSKR